MTGLEHAMTTLGQPVLDQIAIAVSKRVDRHYPTVPLRLEHVRELGDGVVFVPDGPWLVDNHPKRASAPAGRLQPWPTVPDPRSLRLAREWIAQGGSVDQHGNLLHPHWRQLLADPRIGLPTGPGMFWKLGVNLTTDVVMLRDKPEQDDPADPVQAPEEEVLLIQRASNGQHAVPGGFGEPTDVSVVAGGLRELFEETRLAPQNPRVEVVHRELSTGSLTTLHAWTDTTVIWVDADPAWLAQAEPNRRDADGEVVDALWLPVAQLHTVEVAHRYLRYIQLAVQRRRMRHRLTPQHVPPILTDIGNLGTSAQDDGTDDDGPEPTYQQWVAECIGPRQVGGRYDSGYVTGGADTGQYTVLAIDPGPRDGWPVWQITVQRDGHRFPQTHCTAWDPRREKVIAQPDQ